MTQALMVRSSRAEAVGAGVNLTGFVLVVAAPNLPNALLPDYERAFRLDPVVLTVLYSTYILALLVSLHVFRAAWFSSRAKPMLITGLACAAASSAVMIMVPESFALFYVGRVFAGIGLAAATGATAVLLLQALGERGRTLTAVGMIFGALVGNAGAGLVATIAPAVTGYAVHCAMVLLTLVAVLTRVPASRAPLEAKTVDPLIGTAPVPVSRRGTRGRDPRAVGYLLGVVGLSIAGLTQVILPSQVQGVLGARAPLIAIAPAALFLFAGWISQLLDRAGWLRWNSSGVLVTIGVGVTGIAAGVATPSVPLMLIGSVIAGLAQGSGYALGLAVVSAGSAPADHGRLTSRYTSIAYLGCASTVLAVGILLNVAAPSTVLLVASILIAGTGILARVTRRREL